MVRRLEDAGASAITMHSLFEEQVAGEQLATIYTMELYADSYAEALSYFPKPNEFALDCQAYLEHIRKIKEAVAAWYKKAYDEIIGPRYSSVAPPPGVRWP